VSLDSCQKQAGRLFKEAKQARLDEVNATCPAGGIALPFHRVLRHECPERGNASVGIVLHEVYEHSPAYWVCYCSEVHVLNASFPHDDCSGGRVAAEAGLFGFYYKHGTCPQCGLILRSERGQLVLAAARPPAERTRVGGSAGPHDRDSRVARA
jgi:predicted RNA-binding Zn-ribbon protein involved in translation (DUF1610 family)